MINADYYLNAMSWSLYNTSEVLLRNTAHLRGR